MDTIITQYNNASAPLELEYRYKINKDEFKRLFEAHSIGQITYVKSISFVRPMPDHSIIKEMYYDTTPPRVEFRMKKKLNTVRMGNNKLVLSEEIPLDNASVNSGSTIIRQKLRASIIVGEFRHDFTLVRKWDVTDMLNANKRAGIIARIQSMNLAADFIQLIDQHEYNVELELEFVGTTPTRELLESINYQLRNNTDKILTDMHKLIYPQRHNGPINFQRMTNAPHEFNRNTFNSVVENITGYVMCAKTNGMRSLLYISGGNVNIVKATATTSFRTTNMGTYILDTEEMGGKYHVFDVLYANRLLIHEPLAARLAEVPDIPSITRKDMLPITTPMDILRYYTSIAVTGGRGRRVKGGNADAELIKRAASMKLPHDYDGLIFTPIHGDYWSTIYKWKPADLRTSDFLVKVVGNTHILCCSVTFRVYVEYKLSVIPEIFEAYADEMYHDRFPIQFSPTINILGDEPAYLWDNPDNIDINGKVGEFARIDNKWKLLLIRSDKSAGNSYQVCNSNWNASFDPILITDFVAAKKGYFTTSSGDHIAQRKYMNMVKSSIMSRVVAHKVLDMGIGKLQDIHKYINMGIDLLIGIDTDIVALSEACSRRSSTPATWPLLLYNTTMTDQRLIPLMAKHGQFDLVVSNLALHYSADKLPLFAAICAHVLAANGSVVIVDLCAELVDQLPKTWQIYDGEILKYKIIAGKKTIDVYYPFAQKMEREPKLYFEELIAAMAAKGFRTITRGNVTAPEFTFDRSKLSPGDIEWLALWEYIIFGR